MHPDELHPDAHRNRHWNYVAHVLDGGLYMGSLAVVSPNTILPTAIETLGGPSWLVSLAPVMTLIGVTLPPLFTAHLVDRLHRYMPLLLTTGIVQRLPYLLVALLLLGCGSDSSALAPYALAAAPLCAGLACGVSLSAWQQMLANTVPARRRASIFAYRYLIGSVMGLGAGWLVTRVLAAHPGPVGYGRLHLYAFAILCASYATFAMIREPSGDPRPADRHLGLLENLSTLPRLLREHGSLRRFLYLLPFVNGIFIIAPFLAIHLRRVLGKPESFLGQLLIAQMAGAACGNLLAAWLGDRFGGRRLLQGSQVLILAVAASSVWVGSVWLSYAVFFGFGVAFQARQVGINILTLDLVPAVQRATCLAMVGMASLLSMLSASALSALSWRNGESFWLSALLACVWSLSALGLLVLIPEPRDGAVLSPRPRR
jgi:MFS family permease